MNSTHRGVDISPKNPYLGHGETFHIPSKTQERCGQEVPEKASFEYMLLIGWVGSKRNFVDRAQTHDPSSASQVLRLDMCPTNRNRN